MTTARGMTPEELKEARRAVDTAMRESNGTNVLARYCRELERHAEAMANGIEEQRRSGRLFHAPVKTTAEIRVPPQVAPFMARHGTRATDAITEYLASCKTLDEKLGALGVLAQILLAYGDSLQAVHLHNTPATRA